MFQVFRFHFRILVLFTFGLAASANASNVQTLASVKPTSHSESHTIQVDGMTRSYLFYRPATVAASTQAPLVVMLHGRFDHVGYVEKAYHWDQTADAHGFLVAYPQGYKDTWNAGHCCGRSQKEDINEVAFLDALIRSLIATENADPARIYLAGMSNGALMAYRMACESTVPLAGIGSVAGDLIFECPSPRPNSILEIHGSKDPLLPLDGKDKRDDPDYIPSVPRSLEVWRKLDDCAPPTVTTTPDGIEDSAAACAHGRKTELIVLEGAGHQWPGGRRHLPIGEQLFKISQPDERLDATGRLWEFFDGLRATP